MKKSVMIYCDAVESTIVGSQRHSLLRKVELERKGEGRATIELYIMNGFEFEISTLKALKCPWPLRMVIAAERPKGASSNIIRI